MVDVASSANGLADGLSRAVGARMACERGFLGVAALVFAASAAATALWCGSMSAMTGIPMPGGWTMSSAWMPMCGRTWLATAVSFVSMWAVMMVAMMLPSLVPMLQRYRQAIGGTGQTRLGLLTVLAAAGYFTVWTALGMAVFALGAGLAAAAMEQPALARAVPFAAAAVVLLAGGLQFTPWKAHHLVRCRETPTCRPLLLPADANTALRYGLRLGVRCSACCANLAAILIVLGVMDLRVMVVVTAAITAERLLPAGERIAQGIGVFVVTAGWFLAARAAGLE